MPHRTIRSSAANLNRRIGRGRCYVEAKKTLSDFGHYGNDYYVRFFFKHAGSCCKQQ